MNQQSATTCAVHLELTADMTVKTFRMDLERFVMTWRMPNLMVSDNGRLSKQHQLIWRGYVSIPKFNLICKSTIYHVSSVRRLPPFLPPYSLYVFLFMLNFSHSVIGLIENLNSVSLRYKYLHFYNRIYSNMETKIKCFDGTGDVNVFVEKVSLHSSLKGYDGEKAAQNLASKLEGRAFDVYMRLPTADKKDASKIKSELLKEFESGNVDREAAIVDLNNRRRKSDESPQKFAYN